MDFSSSHDFEAEPQQVANVLLDLEYWDAVATNAQAVEHSVQLTNSTVQFSLSVPTSGSATKLVGPLLNLVQNTSVITQDVNNYLIQIELQVIGFPLTMKAEGSLVGTSPGTRMTITGELVVAVPVLGRKIEQKVQPFIAHAQATQIEVAKLWLAK